MRTLKLGTRGSKLALQQANAVAAALQVANPDLAVEVVVIVTRGDKSQTGSQIYRDKRDWVKEIEESLLQGDIDFAVHSAKDVPEVTAAGTGLIPVLNREVPHDALIIKADSTGRTKGSLEILDSGAVVGSSSLRRAAQLKRMRADLVIEPITGNVPTRIEKLDAHLTMKAIVLAAAGLRRLELQNVIGYTFAMHELLPAANQGALAAQFRADDSETANALQRLIIPENFDSWHAERSFVSVLGADCNSSVGAYAEVRGSELEIVGRVLSPCGKECIDDRISGRREDAQLLGSKLAQKMLGEGAEQLLRLS